MFRSFFFMAWATLGKFAQIYAIKTKTRNNDNALTRSHRHGWATTLAALKPPFAKLICPTAYVYFDDNQSMSVSQVEMCFAEERYM